MLKLFSAIGLVVWIVLGVTEIVSLAPPASEQPKNPKDTPVECDSNEKRKSSSISVVVCEGGVVFHTYRDDIAAGSAALLTLITGFLVWIASRQYTTTRAQLRAYVMVETAMAINFGPRPKAQVVFKNFGQTPAHDLTIWTSVEVAIDPLNQKPAKPEGRAETRGPLAPGTVVHTLDSPSRIIVTEEIAGVQNGKAGFYVFGEARYDDVFGENHITEFCYIYGGRDGVHPKGGMAQYKDWNKAT